MATATMTGPRAKPTPRPRCVVGKAVVVRDGRATQTGTGRACPNCGRTHIDVVVYARPGESVEVAASTSAPAPAKPTAPTARGSFHHKMFVPDPDPAEFRAALAAWLRSGGPL